MFGDVRPGPASELEAKGNEVGQARKDGETAEMFEEKNPGGEGRVLGYGSSSKKSPSKPSDVTAYVWGDRSALQNEAVPAAREAGKVLSEAVNGLRSVFAPTSRGPQAKQMAGIAREHGAEMAQRSDRAEMALRKARRFFDGQSVENNMAFIHRMESGTRQPTSALERFAATIRDLLNTRRDEIRAMGTGKLHDFIQNYFPHIWKDPAKAEAVFAAQAKGPMQGGRAFLKQRSIPTIREGIDAGLEPVSENPVDLVLLKLREMDKYAMGQRALAEMKEKGLVKFVRVFDKPPEGYSRINDAIASVYGPPTVKMAEYIDENVYNAMQSTAEKLGITHQRIANAGRGRLGYSVQGGGKIVTQSASETSVIGHELGHQLDVKYNLLERFGLADGKRGGKLSQEFRDLADLHFDGRPPEAVSDSKRAYFRKGAEKVATMLEAYMHASQRFQDVAPGLYEKFDTFLRSRPELAGLVDVKPSLSLKELGFEKPHGGLLKMGEYYAPDAVSNVLNNYLSPGLRRYAAYRAASTASNVLNQAQLGLSFFHLGFTSLDAAVSKFALGLEHLASGNVAGFAKHVAMTPIAPFENFVRGSKVLREWYAPGSQGAEMAKIVDAMKAAGGRARLDAVYRNDLTRNMVKAFRQLNVVGGALRLPGAALETLAKPIMEYVVPRQKMGVFADIARRELARLGPDATHEQVREVMGKAWDSVDNRMGQLVYDNLFWHKTVKDLAMLGVRSLGWNLGTLREIGGGLADTARQAVRAATGNRPQFTHRMAYVAALPLVTGMIGSAAMYLMTGKGPEELKDYFFPKTGETDERGRPVRMALPSYMKDVYQYGHDPAGTAIHKAHPARGVVSDMLANHDFYGEKIYNEDDPAVQKALDAAKYVGKQFVPFSIRNATDASASNLSTADKVLPFVGVTRAPKWLSQTPAEQLASELAGSGYHEPMTHETAERVRTRSALVGGLRSKDPAIKNAAAGKLAEGFASGTLRDGDVRTMADRMEKGDLYNTVKGLDARNAMKVYRVMTPEEREANAELVAGKIVNSRSLSDEERLAMARELIASTKRAIVGGKEQ
jgi:hypothetical protein